MVSWNEILREFHETKLPDGRADADRVRRGKITDLATLTGRPLVTYSADFLNQQKAAASGNEVSIDFRDKEGFLEVTKDLPPGPLDMLIHSAGGLAEAAEAIVKLLRPKFNHIRFIVPNVAKSAATMLALSGNEIVMDEISELGPIDPQFALPRGDGTVVFAPAQAIIDQFKGAQNLLSRDPKYLPAWIPILPLYGPALYEQCRNAIKLSKKLVEGWLSSYMFSNLPKQKARGRARKIANFLGDHRNFLTHARHVGVDQMKELGANVVDMRDDPRLRDKVHALYFAISITYDNTAAFKMVENSSGGAYIRLVQVQQVRKRPAAPQPPQQGPAEQAPPTQ
ncbi:MAG: serine protease [Terriglobia bacterium]